MSDENEQQQTEENALSQPQDAEPQNEGEGQDQPEDDAQQQSETDQDDDGKPKKSKRPGPTERRVARLQAEMAELKELLRNSGNASKPESVIPTNAAPSPDKYEGGELDPKYIVALAKWELKQEQQQAERAQRERTAGERRNAVIEMARSKYDDFDDVMAGTPITPEMAEAITESEIGHDLAYWLGQHPDEAKRIAKLTPLAAAKEIGRIEARLQTPSPKKPTAAPAPIRPVGTSPSVTPDPEKMSVSEWMAWRNKQARG